MPQLKFVKTTENSLNLPLAAEVLFSPSVLPNTAHFKFSLDRNSLSFWMGLSFRVYAASTFPLGLHRGIFFKGSFSRVCQDWLFLLKFFCWLNEFFLLLSFYQCYIYGGTAQNFGIYIIFSKNYVISLDITKSKVSSFQQFPCHLIYSILNTNNYCLFMKIIK